MIVELLPLEPPELLVAVVNDVNVEITDGDVKRPLAAARTSRWSSFMPSSSVEELEEATLRFDCVRRCLFRTPLEESSREAGRVMRLEEEVFDLSLVTFLLTLLLGAPLLDLFDLSFCF